MSQNEEYKHLIDLNLTTAINNILDLLDNRMKALYENSDSYSEIEEWNISIAIKNIIYCCTELKSSFALLSSVQYLNIFYQKYYLVRSERLTHRLENRLLMHFKNKMVYAITQTMNSFDENVLIMVKESFQKHNILKPSHTINMNKSIKQIFRRDNDNGNNPN